MDINVEEIPTNKINVEELRIEKQTSELSQDDASIIANILAKGKQTKGQPTSIKEILVVNDDNAEPVYYIVNYSDNQGFVIVSATKNYVPIIGSFESGNFDPAQKNHPLLGYLDEFKCAIAPINSTQIDSLRMKFAPEWLHFEQVELTIPDTRSVSYDKQAAIKEWTAKGYECFNLSTVRHFLDEAEAEAFIRDVCSRAPSGVDPMEASIFLIKDDHIKYGPLLKTAWHQYAPLNHGASNGIAGCSTVAVAQIMAYHKCSTKFNWNLIGTYPAPSNTEAQRLGVVLRGDLNSTYESNGTFAFTKQTKAVFEKYGYQTNLVDHDVYSPTQTEHIGYAIGNGRPVFMRGSNINNGGHAWVCDGYKSWHTTYSALYIERDFGMSGGYSFYGGVRKKNGNSYFHMNWGYAGANDGWLYSHSADKTETTPSRSTGEGDFSNNRRIIFVTPNK